MEILFGIAVGAVLFFIFIKWREMNGGGNSNSSNTNGGDGYTGVNDGVAGELPKDRIE
jgi:hypothetical protein